jgi:serine/threonine-protein kinase
VLPILSDEPALPRDVGPYTLLEQTAAGGMAAVYLAVFRGADGFQRPVAVKRLHGTLINDPELMSALRYEAWLGAHVRHPNVVSVLDLVCLEREFLLVLEYVHGVTLGTLRSQRGLLPIPILLAIMVDALRGLHAAHTARDLDDQPLRVVHRDVSPQNILVGADGFARILDFGVAKFASKAATRVGCLKGKLRYMAPEQLTEEAVDGRTDLFSAGVVLWECLVGKPLFKDSTALDTILDRIGAEIPLADTYNPAVSRELSLLVARALCPSPDDRYASAGAFAAALERGAEVATPDQVARYVKESAGQWLDAERLLLRGVTPRRTPPRSSEITTWDSETAELTPPSLPSRVQSLIRRERWRHMVTTKSAALLAVVAAVIVTLVIARTTAPESRVTDSMHVAPAKPQAHAPPREAAPSVPVQPLLVTLPAMPAAEPATSHSEMIAASATSERVQPRKKPRRPRAATVRRRTRPPGCNPPFVVDQLGIKRMKRECF